VCFYRRRNGTLAGRQSPVPVLRQRPARINDSQARTLDPAVRLATATAQFVLLGDLDVI